MTWLLVFGCAQSGDSTADGAGTGDSRAGDTADSSADDSSTDDTTIDSVDIPDAECPESAEYVGIAPHAARTLSGSAIWNVDFDAALEAAGYQDCSYSRRYAEAVEREGHGWQCPECSWFTAGEAEVVEGYEDCATLISSSEAIRIEHLGLGEVDGIQHFWRMGVENLALGDMGAALGEGTESSPYAVAWEDEGELSDGNFYLTASGEFTVGERADVTISDVNVPREEAYSCGWTQCNPGGPVESYVLSTGGVFHNARFTDSCGEPVDLWDFWGRYLVIDSSAPDCGPCISLAQTEGEWVAAMASAGIEVEWVTLLNASLSTINLPADPTQVADWIAGTGATGQVLSDDGFAYTVMPAYTGKESGMSYPTMIVVSPDMTVLGWDSGFAAVEDGGDGFGPIQKLIESDIAVRYP